jgi:cell division protein YceG involved in septum cleavage
MLHAPKGPWLYYTVINKDGETKFSTTYKQQEKWELVGKKNGIG